METDSKTQVKKDLRIQSIEQMHTEWESLMFKIVEQKIFKYLYFEIDKEISTLNNFSLGDTDSTLEIKLKRYLKWIHKTYLIPCIKETFNFWSPAAQLDVLTKQYDSMYIDTLFSLFVNQKKISTYKNWLTYVEGGDGERFTWLQRHLYIEKEALISWYKDKKNSISFIKLSVFFYIG